MQNLTAHYLWHSLECCSQMQILGSRERLARVSLPPYCNFLLDPYLEQPETALQQSLVTLLLLTRCPFINVSTSLCRFFVPPFPLHLPMSVWGHARYTEERATRSVISHSNNQSASLSPDCSVNQQSLWVHYTLDFLTKLNADALPVKDSRTGAEVQAHRKAGVWLFCRSSQSSSTAPFRPHTEEPKVLDHKAAGLSREKNDVDSSWSYV